MSKKFRFIGTLRKGDVTYWHMITLARYIMSMHIAQHTHSRGVLGETSIKSLQQPTTKKHPLQFLGHTFCTGYINTIIFYGRPITFLTTFIFSTYL